jgi:hypothetical protein
MLATLLTNPTSLEMNSMVKHYGTKLSIEDQAETLEKI